MFQNEGMTIDDLVALISYEKSFTAFLRDFQNELRVKRSIQKDPEDRCLIGSECIDEILQRLSTLEEARQRYMEEKKRMEDEAKREEEIRKQNLKNI